MAHFASWFLSFPVSLDRALLPLLSCGCNWPQLPPLSCGCNWPHLLHAHPHHVSPVAYQSTKLSISGVQAGLQPTLFSLQVTFWPTVRVKTALVPTFCKLSLLISCLETFHVRTGACLSTFWTASHFSLLWPMTHQISRLVHLFGWPWQWVDIGQCGWPLTHSWCEWPTSTV
jgi:hypothetical protein